jgi:hypothetical protein
MHANVVPQCWECLAKCNHSSNKNETRMNIMLHYAGHPMHHRGTKNANHYNSLYKVLPMRRWHGIIHRNGRMRRAFSSSGRCPIVKLNLVQTSYIALFRFITMLYGTENILHDVFHI